MRSCLATAAGSGAGSLRLEPPAEPPAPLADGARLENVVVGAGPAGLLAACLLAKAGPPVVVVAARARKVTRTRASVGAPSSPSISRQSTAAARRAVSPPSMWG